MQRGAPWELGVSTSRLFERAQAEGVPLVLLTGEGDGWGSGVSADTRARIRADLLGGQWVVVPRRGIRLGQEPRVAWWRIDPKSGVSTAVTDDGLHQVNVEYAPVVAGERWLIRVTIVGHALPAFEVGILEMTVWVEVVMRTGGVMTRVF
jgi:hypothetical protein